MQNKRGAEDDRQDDIRPEQGGERPLPTGLMMALAQNMHAMEHFAALSESQRERLIDAAAQTHSQSQMRSLVSNMEQFMN